MTIFGYGSLLCEDSFKKTVSNFDVLGPATLEGYKRVFNLKSNSRKNSDGIHSCVLNIEKENGIEIYGMLYDIPSNEIEALHIREAGYDLEEITLKDGNVASIYIANVNEPYDYVHGDKIQEEYLEICLNAAKTLGDEFLNNFLDSTYIGEMTLRQLGK